MCLDMLGGGQYVGKPCIPGGVPEYPQLLGDIGPVTSTETWGFFLKVVS